MPVAISKRAQPQPVPRLAGYLPGEGAVDLERLIASLDPGKPVVPIIFYRAMLLAPTPRRSMRCARRLRRAAWRRRALIVTSLKDREAARSCATPSPGSIPH